jgi:hypothetical protein
MTTQRYLNRLHEFDISPEEGKRRHSESRRSKCVKAEWRDFGLDSTYSYSKMAYLVGLQCRDDLATSTDLGEHGYLNRSHAQGFRKLSTAERSMDHCSPYARLAGRLRVKLGHDEATTRDAHD